MTKWEYLMLHYPPLRIVNDVGKKGWELIAIDRNSKFYFKRPMEDDNGKEEAEIEEAQEQEDEEDKDKQEIYTQQGEIFYRSHREDL